MVAIIVLDLGKLNFITNNLLFWINNIK